MMNNFEIFIKFIYTILYIFLFVIACVVCQTGAATVVSNVALGKNAYQSTSEYSNEGGAHLAVDGNFNPFWSGKSCSHTSSEFGAYWEVDLGDVYVVESVSLYNRLDACCYENLVGAEVHIGLTRDTYRVVGYKTGTIYISHTFEISPPVYTRWVRITRNPDIKKPLVFCEVAVNGSKSSSGSFERISDVTGTGNTLDTKFARSIEHCCYICFITQDCLAVTMDNSQCSLLDSDNYKSELGQTIYVIK